MSDFSTNYNSVRTDKGLSAEIINGIINQTEKINRTKTAKEMNELGKDAFLQLLCAQMEYQDPLQPQSNTEWISQLATYSTLEEMKNMGTVMNNSQAFSLIGNEVILNTKDSAGRETMVNGVVEYVSIKNNKAYLSIKGNLYPAEDLQSVVDPRYLHNNVLPKVQQTELKFDRSKPKDMVFRVGLGSALGKATGVALSINGKTIDPSLFKVSAEGVVQLSWAAVKDLKDGKYNITVSFNNDFRTQDSKSLKLLVFDGKNAGTEPKKGEKPEVKPETKPGEKAPETKPGDKPGEKAPETKPGDKPREKAPETKPGDKPDVKPTVLEVGENVETDVGTGTPVFRMIS